MAQRKNTRPWVASPPADDSSRKSPPRLSPRYTLLARLGKGGGGEVWEVEDKADGQHYALKTLREGASEAEVLALVREASTLSGLEGMGVPRVLRFGRLAGSETPYLLRELVHGASLADHLAQPSRPLSLLHVVLQAADQLTRLHRASLLHGDIKPANIMVGTDGTTTLVDLGLAAPWREYGQRPAGLTPEYAAPELLEGKALTVRAEVYSLGATLREVAAALATQLGASVRQGIDAIVAKALAPEPQRRFPSVDELAAELRRVAQLPFAPEVGTVDAAWPIVGLEGTVTKLLTTLAGLGPGSAVHLAGRAGAGRTAVLRRLAWSLGVEGRPVAWVEGRRASAGQAFALEVEGLTDVRSAVVLLDDLHRLPSRHDVVLASLREKGAKLLVTGPLEAIEKRVGACTEVTLPALDAAVAASLAKRAIPSLPDAVVEHLVKRAEGRPGRLRSMVRTLHHAAVVSPADVDRLLSPASSPPPSEAQQNPLEVVIGLLDQGRFLEASSLIEQLPEPTSVPAQLARARLLLGQGDDAAALHVLVAIEAQATRAAATPEAHLWTLLRARTDLRAGRYGESIDRVQRWLHGRDAAPGVVDPLEADAWACLGVAESFLGDHEKALTSLRRSVALAKRAGSARVCALAFGSLALGLQRSDRLGDAQVMYEHALEAAEEAGDAGAIATTRLNLAALATHGQGEIARAFEHLEAAIDMGKRAGRQSTVQQALLNLVNLDLYVGRLSRAAANIDVLVAQKDTLAANRGQQAQLLGLQAELAARQRTIPRATQLYDECADAYDALGRHLDASEARIEGVLVGARGENPDPSGLATVLEKVAAQIGPTGTHRASLGVARGVVAALTGDEPTARQALLDALHVAKESGQKEWVWRALDHLSRLELEHGRPLAARRNAEEALAVLEDIAARLPRDLREVYWNDPRRAGIRAAMTPEAKVTRTFPGGEALAFSATLHRTTGTTAMAALAEDRLARILEINRDLAMVPQLDHVLERVVFHAVALVQAERGFVVLLDAGGALSVQARHVGTDDESRQVFSQSIAERAISTGQPVVSLSARDDDRMAGFASVHQIQLQSVACVPIHAPRGAALGALYLETRTRRGNLFEKEIGTLCAFADQAAIAIENARLLEENKQRADALAQANLNLDAAQKRLAELLAQKKVQLAETKRDLKDTQAVLRSHFGYQGLVGTSDAMRRVYALIERVKDTDIPVLITGESGTGKEMVARAIHQGSPRVKQAFTGINCGAIPEHLLESELFGHVRGSFTGADRDRKGLLRDSQGGTVLLDEIGEMPMKMQAGLLRVLQERKVRPVGGTAEEPIDVRIIAATHRSLESMIAEGTFREDLYYRLRVVEMRVPPLRERPEDIPILLDHFLQRFAVRYRREKGSLTREALRALMACPWPGNVRQLENVLLQAWVLREQDDLDVADFELPGAPPVASRRIPSSMAPPVAPPPPRRSELPTTDRLSPVRTEKDDILEALKKHAGNRLRAAEALGMPRRTFYRRLKEYGIQE